MLSQMMVNTGECKMNGRIVRRVVVIYDFKAIFSSETSAPCQAKLKRLAKRILEAVLSSCDRRRRQRRRLILNALERVACYTG